MTHTDKDEINSSEAPTLKETPTLDPNANMEIINFINSYDVKGNCYLYHEGEEKLVPTLLRSDDRKRISLMKELEEARTIRQLHKTRLFKDHPFLKKQRRIILLPYSSISKSYMPTSHYSERDINRTNIINTFWKSKLELHYDAAEASILVCSFLAKNIDRNTHGLGISQSKIAIILGMSVRRVSDTLKRLEQFGYVIRHKEKATRGKLSLGTFIQVTEAFSSQFFIPKKPEGESEKKQQKSSESQSQESPEKRYFQFLQSLSDLRLDLKNFIVKSKDPIPPAVLQQIFKVLE
ncbi:MarR family transcriptional regulator [Vibrio parahaemolyticus]|uniref:MarR family transcriptional regulator n=4 Tax=Vibrio parahaemolyticus TaxID=670 RepID=UPI0011247F5C|nr:MarR family transcriptional regulator [Vibrio parahaemolyticus]TOL73751.1 MarR family transcriptional regulator [Vibrio parahaemolyticus]TON31170.1 MarR family transcriptional regulator [Vibrio parahaemolyticus]TOO69731.1 MarR family transcriptional regulator [Vibrio parahaemolyticus]TOR29103.1 MarR family transcriptional regulator [Vibrio parahaemolyticus]